MDALLKIKFDGLAADKHVIGMRGLGQSLIGLERIINVGLVGLAEGRPPKRGEKFPLMVVTKSPKSGSVELITGLTEVASIAWTLPLITETFSMTGNAIISHWVSAVMLKLGGRVKEADPHFSRLADLMDSQGNRDLEARRMDQAFLLGVIDRLQPSAKEFVAPLGRSCSTLKIGQGGDLPLLTVDEPTAEIIRAGKEMELSDMQEMTLRIDGFTHHNRKLKVGHPFHDGRYINADIRDPLFDESPNAYTDAAASKAEIKVLAKLATSDEEIQRIYIMGLA